jgi:glucuronate isomerase
MKNNPAFMDEDFLLHSEMARKLFHGYASGQPIIDYHCHLPPQDLADNRVFENITKIWLDGDHYKWRAMRATGIAENLITGSAPDRDKFRQWATTVPKTLRNPLYHWTHLELRRYFDFNDLLSSSNADQAYDHCTEQLQQPSHATRALIDRMNVAVIGTTDDPADTLEHHQRLKASGWKVSVLPSFRPDLAYSTDDPAAYNAYLDRLGITAGMEIRSLADLLRALEIRMDYFYQHGCRLSDHGLEYIPLPDHSTDATELIFELVRSGKKISKEQSGKLKFHLLTELGKMYHHRGWTQQFHLGALRNNNARMMKQIGANTGYDSIGDFSQATGMARLFSTLDDAGMLARTIIYNLNPADNELFATMAGNFNDGTIEGKIQYGSGWWFLDQKDGMEKQLNALSNMGLLSGFVGMLTDSRSFLSYPRHEYFRRILCNMVGRDVENGELPADEQMLGNLVADICYRNAKKYFRF